jgi:hypothetical protein
MKRIIAQKSHHKSRRIRNYEINPLNKKWTTPKNQQQREWCKNNDSLLLKWKVISHCIFSNRGSCTQVEQTSLLWTFRRSEKKAQQRISFHGFVLNCKYNTRFIAVTEFLIKQMALDFIPDSNGKLFFRRKKFNCIYSFPINENRRLLFRLINRDGKKKWKGSIPPKPRRPPRRLKHK